VHSNITPPGKLLYQEHPGSIAAESQRVEEKQQLKESRQKIAT
jgi:hypothetical protein